MERLGSMWLLNLMVTVSSFQGCSWRMSEEDKSPGMILQGFLEFNLLDRKWLIACICEYEWDGIHGKYVRNIPQPCRTYLCWVGSHITSVRARPMQQALNQMGNSNMQFMQMQMPGSTLRVGEQGTSRLADEHSKQRGQRGWRDLAKKNWWPFLFALLGGNFCQFVFSLFSGLTLVQHAVFSVGFLIPRFQTCRSLSWQN